MQITLVVKQHKLKFIKVNEKIKKNDVVVSESANQQQHVTVTETVMQKFLDKVGIDHFPEFDQDHPGLSLTEKGYIYDPTLLTASQSRKLSGLVIELQNEPNYF